LNRDAKITTDPARAVKLYETFLAGCHAKADELDDSTGSFGLVPFCLANRHTIISLGGFGRTDSNLPFACPFRSESLNEQQAAGGFKK